MYRTDISTVPTQYPHLHLTLTRCTTFSCNTTSMVKSSSTTTHAPHAVGTLRDKVAIQPAREASECIPFPDFGEVPSLPSMQNATITTPSALLFVGQGAQKIGMTADVMHLPEVARMYEVAERILGYDLKKIVLEGPENLLNQTLHSQPALLIAGLAAVEKLKHETPTALDQIAYVAGLSLGEYTALVYARALTFEDAIRLVQVRAMAMQSASETTQGEMMTVVGLEDAALKRHCVKARKATKEFVQISNFLNPKGRVISGQPNAVAAVRNVLQANTGVRLFDVPVSGAFHTKLMAPAQDALIESLSNTPISEPTVPVIANINGRPYATPQDIQEGLARQLVGQVMWQKSVEYMISEGATVMYDMGPGKQIMGMLRQINKPIAKADRPTAVNIEV